jgi:signal peptidase I
MRNRKAILIGTIMAGLLLVFFLNPFNIPSWSPISRIAGIQVFRNPTISMEPTLSRGSMIVASAWPYMFREPQAGDVVVFKFPPDPSVLYVKRIIASGGSSVSLSKCTATVDDKPLNEPYEVAEGEEGVCTLGLVLVPEDHYFVLGDNRANAFDSRAWGFLPKKNVVALVLAE